MAVKLRFVVTDTHADMWLEKNGKVESAVVRLDKKRAKEMLEVLMEINKILGE